MTCEISEQESHTESEMNNGFLYLLCSMPLCTRITYIYYYYYCYHSRRAASRRFSAARAHEWVCVYEMDMCMGVHCELCTWGVGRCWYSSTTNAEMLHTSSQDRVEKLLILLRYRLLLLLLLLLRKCRRAIRVFTPLHTSHCALCNGKMFISICSENT